MPNNALTHEPVLFKYMLELFGAESLDELFRRLDAEHWSEDYEGLKEAPGLREFWGSSWEEKLREAHEAVKRIEQSFREATEGEFKLFLPFQYLALLFTQVYIDLLKEHPKKLLRDLNRLSNERGFGDFSAEDLRRLAFWMATGSGKTLIAQANYLQLKHWERWERVIILTPGEVLTRQHADRLERVGIRGFLAYTGETPREALFEADKIIIDINKIQREFGDKTVAAEFLRGKNLILVDEGHKGTGEKNDKKEESLPWRERRRLIAGEGSFVLEYSATFGEVAENDALSNLYSKCIIFNYSLPAFHHHGYGKNFFIFNLDVDGEYNNEEKKMVLAAALLSYYTQLVAFEGLKAEKRRLYGFYKPLWVFMGASVLGTKTEYKSDIKDILEFIKEILVDEGLLVNLLRKVLNHEKLEEIKRTAKKVLGHLEVEEIARGIYEKVFYGRGELEIWRKSKGELGLKVAGSERYFGLVYVGELSLEESKFTVKSGLEIDLFPLSESPDPQVDLNLLIGARKFTEGWDSYRVSTMSLLSVGEGKGPMAIQILGRGIRLRGKNGSLKREELPERNVEALQTLFVFGIKASYVKKFLEGLKEEGIGKIESKRVSVERLLDDKALKLPIFKLSDSKEGWMVRWDNNVARKVRVWKGVRILSAVSRETIEREQEREGVPLSELQGFKPKEFVDWKRVFVEANTSVSNGGFRGKLSVRWNFIERVREGEEIWRQIFVGRGLFEKIEKDPAGSSEILTELAAEWVKKYLKKYADSRGINDAMVDPTTLGEVLDNLVPRTVTLWAQDGRKVQQALEAISQQGFEESWFKIHLYKPVFSSEKMERLSGREVKARVQPSEVVLNRGETKLLEILAERSKEREIKVLRNISQKGIFLPLPLYQRFYPDFIVWWKAGDGWGVALIDPKGLGRRETSEVIKFVKAFNEGREKIAERIRSVFKGIPVKVCLFLEEGLQVVLERYPELREYIPADKKEATQKGFLDRNNISFLFEQTF